MQNKLLSVLIAATVLAGGARAEDANAPVTAPTQPAPVVQQPTPMAQAATQTAPAPNQIIYAPRLPSPSELTNAASAQGITVQQIIQSAAQVTVVYRYPNGELKTIAYQLLPTGNAATTVVAPSPAPTVVYTTPRVIYYDNYDPYWPHYYYPPVSLSLGFGWYGGHWDDDHWGGRRWGGGGHWGGHHWR